VAGIVSLAGSTRPLQDVVIDQAAFFAAREPGNAAAQHKVDEARAFKKRLEDPALGPAEDVAFPFGGTSPGAYWLSLRGYDAPAVAGALGIPVLILQGARDYQVTAPDFEGWKRALDGRPGK
jgi:hypothetical protein